MGRPQKQTASYFKHFTDSGGRTRFILESRWGNDGYAFWFKLLETLAAKDGHYINLSSETEYEYFASKMRIPQETIEEIIRVLVDMENIDRELWETRRVIWCQSLVDNLSDLYSRSLREGIGAYLQSCNPPGAWRRLQTPCCFNSRNRRTRARRCRERGRSTDRAFTRNTPGKARAQRKAPARRRAETALLRP